MNALQQNQSGHLARLLILEDDAGHAEALRRAFTAAHWTTVEIVISLAAFRLSYAAHIPDLVLADLYVPDGDAFELLHAPAEAQAHPTVIMTSHGDERKVVEVLKAGAFDYVVKSPETFVDMPNTLARIEREWALIQQRKQADAQRDALQQQLAQAQKLEAIGRLTGGLAHDFNNILASILGYTELSLEFCAPGSNNKLSEYLTQVKNAAERARTLVASMLALTRPRQTEASAVVVADTAREVIQLLRPIVPSSIQLELHTDTDLPQVRIDAARLHQVLMNLCINARDSIDEHGRIDVKLELLDLPAGACTSCGAPLSGRWFAVAVRDNGSGMTPAVLQKIFDPFYTTKAVGHGTGLGLSMVHSLLHEVNAHVLATSVPGQGSTIQLLFPPLDAIDVAQPAPHVARALRKGASQRILIVDDDADLAQLLADTLTSYGYAPQQFTDSKAALRCFTADPTHFDAVITDYTMPAMTGGELARELLAQRPGLPIMICTGYSNNFDATMAKQLGIARYLEKPVPLELLLKSLADILPAKDNAER